MSLFDIESKKEELKKLEEQTQQESFWQQDTSISSKVLAKIKELKHKIDEFELAQNEASNLIELTELANLEVDEEVAKDILKSTKKLEDDVEKIQLETLLSGKYDRNNANINIASLGQAVQNHKIGQKCFIECIRDGLLKKDMK